ncbi:MAG: tetratricopeptide repeat protein [Chitinophagaceae bacterium]
MKKSSFLSLVIVFTLITISVFGQAKQWLKGHAAYKEGDYNTAIQYFKECVKLVPGDETNLRWLGHAYYYNKQYKEAIESYKSALNLDPSKNTDSWLQLAYSYYGLGQYDLAVSAMKKMIELTPDNSDNFATLSNYYRWNKQYDEAITAAKRAIDIKPDNSHAYVSLGSAYGSKNQNDEAIKALIKATELNPENKNAYEWMGNIYYKSYSFNKAVFPYKKLVEIAPLNTNYYFNLALTYYNMGSYNNALASINKVLDLFTLKGSIGINFFIEDNFPVIKGIIKWSPAKKADLHFGDKITEIDGKSMKKLSHDKISSFLNGTPGSQVSLTLERAEEKIKKYVPRENVITEDGALALGLRSLIFSQTGKFSEALNDAQKAFLANSKDNYVLVSLSAAYINHGQYEEALKLLENPKNGKKALMYTAIAYAKLGKLDEAKNAYLLINDRELLSKNIPIKQDNKIILEAFKPLVIRYREKATAFETQNQYKEALAELTEAVKIADETESKAILENMFSIVRKNPLLSETSEEGRKFGLRGELLVSEGKIEQAATEFDKAILAAPYMAKLYYNNSLVHLEMKKYDEAIMDMKTYLLAVPDAPNSRELKDDIIRWEFLMEKEQAK